MVKRYYSLDEAAAYLSERTDKKVSLRDLFDLIQLRAVRLCCWYAGNIALLHMNEEGYHGDDIILGFYRFRGYVASDYDLFWVSPPLIEGTNSDQTYHVHTCEIIESLGDPLPPALPGESYEVWNRDFPKSEYVGMPIHEVQMLEDPECKYAGTSISVCRESLQIPAIDLESVLSGAIPRRGEETRAGEQAAIAAREAPAYLSPSHESYPPELAAAVMLWEALYIRGEKSQHHGHTQAAKLWLEKNRDSLPTAHLSNHGSTAWLERLTSITSPDAKKQKR